MQICFHRTLHSKCSRKANAVKLQILWRSNNIMIFKLSKVIHWDIGMRGNKMTEIDLARFQTVGRFDMQWTESKQNKTSNTLNTTEYRTVTLWFWRCGEPLPVLRIMPHREVGQRRKVVAATRKALRAPPLFVLLVVLRRVIGVYPLQRHGRVVEALLHGHAEEWKKEQGGGTERRFDGDVDDADAGTRVSHSPHQGVWSQHEKGGHERNWRMRVLKVTMRVTLLLRRGGHG